MYYYIRTRQQTESSNLEKPDQRFSKTGDTSGFSYTTRDPSPSIYNPSEGTTNPIFVAESPRNTPPPAADAATDVETGSPVDPTEDGWGKHEDEKGKVYFFNSKTGETRWTTPAGWKEEIPSNRERPRSRAEEEGWGKYEDDLGRVYYFNTLTGKTQWVPPSSWVQDQTSPVLSSDKPTTGDQGWKKVLDDQGTPHYFNADSGESTWTPPEGWVDNEQQWSKNVDEHGRTYYFNSTTGESSWTPPEGWNNEEEVQASKPAQVATVSENVSNSRSSLLVAGLKASDASKEASSLAARLQEAASSSAKNQRATDDLEREL